MKFLRRPSCSISSHKELESRLLDCHEALDASQDRARKAEHQRDEAMRALRRAEAKLRESNGTINRMKQGLA